MTLRQYEAFLKTVECASVSAAAQALGVSQSALTQLLAGLERETLRVAAVVERLAVLEG